MTADLCRVSSRGKIILHEIYQLKSFEEFNSLINLLILETDEPKVALVQFNITFIFLLSLIFF